MRASLLALALLACNGDKSSSTGAPTLSDVQAQVFTPSCAYATCHAAPGASGLVLEDGASYDALVNVDSADNPGHTFVIPGNSADSYLMHKLNGGPDITGFQMPNTGVPLDADLIQLVADWIDDGAQDN
jgi:hypothetical protein